MLRLPDRLRSFYGQELGRRVTVACGNLFPLVGTKNELPGREDLIYYKGLCEAAVVVKTFLTPLYLHPIC